MPWQDRGRLGLAAHPEPEIVPAIPGSHPLQRFGARVWLVAYATTALVFCALRKGTGRQRVVFPARSCHRGLVGRCSSRVQPARTTQVLSPDAAVPWDHGAQHGAHWGPGKVGAEGEHRGLDGDLAGGAGGYTRRSAFAWLLLGVALIGILARRAGIPYAIALVLGGLIVEESHLIVVPQIDPPVVLFAFLPPLLFDAAFRLDAREFRLVLRPVLLLAVPGVLVTTLVVGEVVALALSPAQETPTRVLLINMAFGVVLFTLIAQGFTLGVLVRRLGLCRAHASPAAH